MAFPSPDEERGPGQASFLLTSPRQDAAVVRFKCPPGEVPQHLGPAYGDIGSYLHEAGIEHEDAGVDARVLTFGPEFEVEAGFTVHAPVQPHGHVQPGELPEGEVATAVHIGPYSGLVAATTALREWIAANGRKIGGGPWELYLSDPQTTPEAELRTEVVYPLKPL